MTPVLEGIDLGKVSSRCAKPRCRTKDFVLHRHHKGHEYLFVTHFAWRIDQPRYVEFVQRYFQYHPSDVVQVCSSHHREVHELYRVIIEAHIRKFRKRLRDFTWGEAQILMQALITSCNDWLAKPSRGSRRPWPSNGKTKRRAEDADSFLQELKELPF